MRAIQAAAVPRPVAEIAGYHAPVYYDPEATQASAKLLRLWIGERVLVRIGRWHGAGVGPHD